MSVFNGSVQNGGRPFVIHLQIDRKYVAAGRYCLFDAAEIDVRGHTERNAEIQYPFAEFNDPFYLYIAEKRSHDVTAVIKLFGHIRLDRDPAASGARHLHTGDIFMEEAV